MINKIFCAYNKFTCLTILNKLTILSGKGRKMAIKNIMSIKKRNFH